MIVKILGYKISLEIVILMLVIYLVMMVHALASCCNGSAIAEGFAAPDPMTRKNSSEMEKLRRDLENIMRTKTQDQVALNEESKRIQEQARIQLENLRNEDARIQSEKIKRAIELERSHKRGKTRF